MILIKRRLPYVGCQNLKEAAQWITLNGNTYADDNPVMNRDPDGEWAWAVVNAGFAVYDGYKNEGYCKSRCKWWGIE